jgi:hypothetical protein
MNQSDVQEREKQVSLMGVVYQRATRQLIWLGPNEWESQVMDAFDYICRYVVREMRESQHAVS